MGNNAEHVARCEELSNAWLHTLQIIPGVSESKAQSLIGYYPSLRSLMEEYGAMDSEDARAGLLQDKLGTGRREGALSRKIYRVFASSDANEVL